jgi:L-ascorbate metabolism protein UlaG (beta-lactamase superfamily)
MVPIGGVFTMDANQASEAVKMLKPKVVIPIHYGSFPILAKTADEFVKLCKQKAPDVQVAALSPGETFSL